MITIYEKYQIRTKGNKKEIELRGLSTDEKPTQINNKPISNGTIFLEIDTGNVYLYDLDNELWKKI